MLPLLPRCELIRPSFSSSTTLTQRAAAVAVHERVEDGGDEKHRGEEEGRREAEGESAARSGVSARRGVEPLNLNRGTLPYEARADGTHDANNDGDAEHEARDVRDAGAEEANVHCSGETPAEADVRFRKANPKPTMAWEVGRNSGNDGDIGPELRLALQRRRNHEEPPRPRRAARKLRRRREERPHHAPTYDR